MVAPGHAAWKSVMACSMAFFWADEPSPFSVPVAQLVAFVLLPLAPGVAVALLSEPQDVRASVPTRATPVTPVNRRRDWIFTVIGPLHSRGRSGGRWCPLRTTVKGPGDSMLGDGCTE